uniref:NADH-ubiquinone oxidoreductase chain 5 n=1 Tax=Camarochiloides weiweii TaxID=2785926 RepID=A0A873QJC7_9HEMI|nr:NADH dehydrogenase subunit 5 [Camarochiloides weiweii]
MNKMSLYILSGNILFFFSSILFFFGLYLLKYNMSYMVDWEFMTINSSTMVMTLLFDWMSLIFMSCVLLISSMVVFYSESYMGGDIFKKRFLFLVLMFILSMMLMIISPNLISILIGWDGLGLVSYCLVIYFQNYKSYNAGMLTVLTNRVGDVAILISISWMMNCGSWHFIYYVWVWDYWSLYLMILIILAGFTKSAQIPFSSWLPAAMAAPTPVSALVHSSTLVTAGVYLLIRFSPLFSSYNCWFFVMLSMMTMFMSGLGANFEFDLKKIIALSTLSQLGLMMSILFIGYSTLAFFHLLTHAFFKALLFLCAGLMIHCMSDSQDIRHMGNLSHQLPFTCTCFCISNLSLCGLPFLAGFYSKDYILEMMSYSYYNMFVFMIFFISVGLTVSYSTRLIYYCLTYNKNMYVCQSYYEDFIMNFSMIMLTMLAVIGGSCLSWLLFPSPDFMTFPLIMKLLPILFVLFGGLIGYELSYMGYHKLMMLNMKFSTFYMGSMWFMPSISTYMIYNNGLSLSNNYIESMDGGWGEFMISNSPLNYFSIFGKLNQIYQNNNIKIFMLTFFFLFILLKI